MHALQCAVHKLVGKNQRVWAPLSVLDAYTARQRVYKRMRCGRYTAQQACRSEQLLYRSTYIPRQSCTARAATRCSLPLDGSRFGCWECLSNTFLLISQSCADLKRSLGRRCFQELRALPHAHPSLGIWWTQHVGSHGQKQQCSKQTHRSSAILCN